MFGFSTYSVLSEFDHWLWEMTQMANREANERFILKLLKPILPVVRHWWRWNRPLLVRRLPMWSARRWKSVT